MSGLNKKLLAGILASAISSASFAAPVLAKKINFLENQNIPVVLSDSNINRIFVNDDEISAISAPASFMELKLDGSGGALVTVRTPQSFTAFVSTVNGRHFSLKVQPKNEDGQTLKFQAEGGSIKANHWEKDNPYTQLLIDMIRETMAGKTPKGFGYRGSTEPSFQFNEQLNMQPINIWAGNKLSVVEYQIDNTTDKKISITPEMFYKGNVRAVAISSITVGANQSQHVYEVLAND